MQTQWIENCGECEGYGYVERIAYHRFYDPFEEVPCEHCQGSGIKAYHPYPKQVLATHAGRVFYRKNSNNK